VKGQVPSVFVTLSEAKGLAQRSERCFASLSMTICAVLAFVVTACNAMPTPRLSVRMTLIGDDSMQWLGSTLATVYSQQHPNVTITVQSANADTALSTVSEISGTIGMVSRVVKPSELSGERVVVVARDGIAVIVNRENPINAIMTSQIAQVFSGEISTWPTGPNAGKLITVVSREDGSGTRDAFEQMAMKGTRVTRTAVVMPGEAAVVDYVARHPDAIGYCSMSSVTDAVQAMTVNDVPLTPQNVESQKYPFVRTLAFIVPLTPGPTMQDFINFTLSSEGQRIIAQKYGRAP
jgi:phosphate transport system substrate-binding protein